jgi:hypothetical protein
LLFDGYGLDGRGLWEIEEVRLYVKLLRAAVPEWAWYLRKGDPSHPSMGFILLATANCDDPMEQSPSESREMLSETLDSLGYEAGRSGSPQSVYSPIVDECLALFTAWRSAD